jgi:hypothetical protein
MLTIGDEPKAVKKCFYDNKNDDLIEGYFPQINVNGEWAYIWDKNSPIEKVCVSSRKEALRISQEVIENHKKKRR